MTKLAANRARPSPFAPATAAICIPGAEHVDDVDENEGIGSMRSPASVRSGSTASVGSPLSEASLLALRAAIAQMNIQHRPAPSTPELRPPAYEAVDPARRGRTVASARHSPRDFDEHGSPTAHSPGAKSSDDHASRPRSPLALQGLLIANVSQQYQSLSVPGSEVSAAPRGLRSPQPAGASFAARQAAGRGRRGERADHAGEAPAEEVERGRSAVRQGPARRSRSPRTSVARARRAL